MKDPLGIGVTCIVSLTPVDPFRPNHTPCLETPRFLVLAVLCSFTRHVQQGLGNQATR